ncbi:MAG TPA: UvrD-helicase domain-containing protein [Patescibacteria group bacterium]|nr:UvrD-helicase domain-containing protein [Patescibacteria group bacterium]
MTAYREALNKLNEAQKLAVTTTDGPVLVIAGPGTGKTQLLSVRVARILQETDTLPQNILCLTFTESGAANMRERLTRFIGQSAYDVNIGTYHAFGGDLIRRFPEVFAETRLQSPADELTKRQILREIVEGLSYKDPLKQLRHHLGDLIGTISEVKRALLDTASLRAIASENNSFIVFANSEVQTVFGSVAKMPGTAAKALPLFEQLFEALQKLVPEDPIYPQFGSLAQVAVLALRDAILSAQEENSSKPLTAWKNKWLAKDENNQFIIAGSLENRRIQSLADVFEKYQEALAEHGWYDFDDMILRAIQALQDNPDLRYSLQEQYLYILLDEFQDTNAAQLRLVQLLSDNPVNEGRPNILAVGDDDQAIYAFQGAQYSNMLDFYHMYRDVKVVNLTDNYRSSGDILATARNVSIQIEARLEKHFDGMSKELAAANGKLPKRAHLERREFLSDVAQYDWIAQQIKQLIDNGTSPSEIAILAPKHKLLENQVPYLAELGIPVRYEKRENILEAPVVKQLLTMSRLVVALHANDNGQANALWSEVLSFDFWAIPVAELWQLSWAIGDKKREENYTWSRALLESDKPYFKNAALFFLRLASLTDIETCEQMLDYLIGSDALKIKESLAIRSQLREFYTGETVQQSNPELFYSTISHLTVLRAKLREYEATQDSSLTLHNLITFVEMYEAAEERMLNTSPYNQQADAVQLMTVFKAKGLEFEHVFLPCMQDDVWGSSSRGNSNKLTLPANLAPIRHAGATDDERLRILFVAITRAKLGLHLTSFAKTYSGKQTKRLKFLDEQEQEDGTFKSLVLPEHAQAVQASDHQAPTLASLELNWHQRHIDARGNADLRGLLSERLEKYQLSPTHLNTFIDTEYGGPDQFFFNVLLRFPTAPSANGQFGDAIHETLEWVQHQTAEQGKAPAITATVQHFAAIMGKRKMTEAQLKLEIERGERALSAYLATRGRIFKPSDKAEHNFRNEGVFVGDVHMAGKVDRMEIDHQNKTITVVDYKTGRSYSRWESTPKLHRYQLQLYCYKLLIEGSHTYKNYKVTHGRLEFIEPDTDNRIHSLELAFKDEEVERTRQLLQAMWQCVKTLEFPDISDYEATMAGIKRLEDDLIATNRVNP